MKWLELLRRYGRVVAEYGPEVIELFELIKGAYDEIGPKVVDLLKRIRDDLEAGSVTLLTAYESDCPDLVAYCEKFEDANEYSTAAIGDGTLFRRLIEFIKNNPELIGIIIGLLEAEGE